MSNEFSRLPPKPGQMQINQKQGSLALEIDKQTEIQGIGMGVLKDGTPFLNQRGLARLCGIENAHIGTNSSQWNARKNSITPCKAKASRFRMTTRQYTNRWCSRMPPDFTWTSATPSSCMIRNRCRW